jgi:hypothetical protein
MTLETSTKKLTLSGTIKIFDLNGNGKFDSNGNGKSDCFGNGTLQNIKLQFDSNGNGKI